MNAHDVVTKAEGAGVTLFVREGKLGARPIAAVTKELRATIVAHKSELIELIQARIDETAHSNPAESSADIQRSAVQQRGVHPVSVASDGAGQRNVAGAAEAPQVGAVATPTSPIKHARRRALAGTPPPATLPLTDTTHAFLYSVLKDGRVERGTFVSKGLKTEPEAYAFLRKRSPGLTVQWARVVTHRVCAGCQYFTGGVLCNADRAPDYAVVVGSCEKYTKAGEL
jgi:tubulysin polyketide synthase-like protein